MECEETSLAATVSPPTFGKSLSALISYLLKNGMAARKLKARALLIDLDGTIVDAVEVFEAAVEEAFSAIGHNPSSGKPGLEVVRCLQLNTPLDGFFERNNVSEASREDFLGIFLQSFYTLATGRTKLFPNAKHTLHELAKIFSLALITRRQVQKAQVAKELERLRIDRFFKTIITSLEVARPTPYPDALLKAANELKAPIDNCVVVSDSGVDIQAGKRAGTKTVAVLSGLFGEEELRKENPDLIIEDIGHLANHLVAA